jgi:hypothetical protein
LTEKGDRKIQGQEDRTEQQKYRRIKLRGEGQSLTRTEGKEREEKGETFIEQNIDVPSVTDLSANISGNSSTSLR